MTSPKTILVVDDNPEVLNAMRTVLEKEGYRLVTASDGNMGLALAERDRPDLIVVDVMMPLQSGFRVVEQLNRRPGGPPVIMITAKEEGRHRAYAEQTLGVADYIRKPFDMSRLLGSVHRLCPLEQETGKPLPAGGRRP